MTATTNAITSKRWIRPPATWNPQPRSQRIMRIAKIVQSIDTPSNRKTQCDNHQKVRSGISGRSCLWKAGFTIWPCRNSSHCIGCAACAAQTRCRKRFSSPNYLAEWGSHRRSRPVVYAIFLQLAIQSGLTDTERTRGHELVAIELTQSINDCLLFQFSQRQNPGLLAWIRSAKGCRPYVGRKIRGL